MDHQNFNYILKTTIIKNFL